MGQDVLFTFRKHILAFSCAADFKVRHFGAQIHRLGNALDRGWVCYRAAPKPRRKGDSGGTPWLARATQPKEAQRPTLSHSTKKALGISALWVVGDETYSGNFLVAAKAYRVSKRCL